jgi:hypothetical protein
MTKVEPFVEKKKEPTKWFFTKSKSKKLEEDAARSAEDGVGYPYVAPHWTKCMLDTHTWLPIGRSACLIPIHGSPLDEVHA